MSQKHAQEGTFHVTTNANGSIPWCTWKGVPRLLIDNIFVTRDLHKAQVFAFCILPNHIHMILCPGEKGLVKFMQAFKSNSSKDVRAHITNTLGRGVPAAGNINRKHVALKNIRWQNGFHDERLRDARQRSNAMRYVTLNPLKHHLIENIDEWPWTSLHFQHLLDPLEIWLR